MEKPDARHLTIETQNYLRQQAIRLRQHGKRVCDISEYLGVHRNTVSAWWWEYLHQGEEGLYQQKRGRQVGDGRTLSPPQEAEVETAIRDHLPETYGIDSALWTRRAVRTLIAQLCEVQMPIRTVGEYLKRWGYSPQKPLERAYEQDPQAVEQWVTDEYPALVQRAQAEGATLQWGDESGVRSDDVGGRGYAPIGHTPEIHPSQRNRERVNYIASLDNQGTVRFMLYTCTLTASVLIQFLERLIQAQPKKVFWIVDRHPVHRDQQVQAWLAEHQTRIEMVYLPSYSPQLNPVEYLNGAVKQGVHDKPPTRNLRQLKRRVLSQLRKLQKLPAQIRSYFQHPSITYAAA